MPTITVRIWEVVFTNTNSGGVWSTLNFVGNNVDEVIKKARKTYDAKTFSIEITAIKLIAEADDEKEGKPK